jgi:ABC-2 type transport system permease protein
MFFEHLATVTVIMNEFKAEIIANWEIIKKNFAAGMAMRAAFALQVLGMMINDTFFLVVWIFFFHIFGRVNGWSATEYLAMLGVNTAGFGIAMSLFYGSAMLPRMVDNGSFDSLLLSPRRLYFRVLTSALKMSAIGDFFFGLALVALYWYFSRASFGAIAELLSLIIPAAVIISNFSLFTSLIAFLLPDSFVISKSAFDVFLSPSLYPGGLFGGALRFIFIFIIPSLAIGGLPVESVMQADWKIYALVWILAIAWTIFTVWALSAAVKKYESGNLTGARV